MWTEIIFIAINVFVFISSIDRIVTIDDSVLPIVLAVLSFIFVIFYTARLVMRIKGSIE